MPRYKNSEEQNPVRWRGITWESGQERDVPLFCPSHLGLTKVSDAPLVPGVVLLAEDVVVPAGGSVRKTIPPSLSGWMWLAVYPLSGSGSFSLGDGAAAIPVSTSSWWAGDVCWGRAESICILSDDGGVFRVVAEERPSRPMAGLPDIAAKPPFRNLVTADAQALWTITSGSVTWDANGVWGAGYGSGSSWHGVEMSGTLPNPLVIDQASDVNIFLECSFVSSNPTGALFSIAVRGLSAEGGERFAVYFTDAAANSPSVSGYVVVGGTTWWTSASQSYCASGGRKIVGLSKRGNTWTISIDGPVVTTKTLAVDAWDIAKFTISMQQFQTYAVPTLAVHRLEVEYV